MAGTNVDGYRLLSTNYVFQDVELIDSIAPKTTEPITITYPTYMKIVQYVSKSENKYDLIERIYRKDMSTEIEHRKTLPKFCHEDIIGQLHIVRVDAVNNMLGESQTQLDNFEETKISADGCRICGANHFTTRCPRWDANAPSKQYDLTGENKNFVNMNLSDYCYSIRVINLPRNCTEDDWKKTIQFVQENCHFKIRMIGMRKGNFNGTCIVSYKNKNDAEQGLKIFNNMTYGTSILECVPADDRRR